MERARQQLHAAPGEVLHAAELCPSQKTGQSEKFLNFFVDGIVKFWILGVMNSSILLQTREMVGHSEANQFRRSRPVYSRWITSRRLVSDDGHRKNAAEWLMSPLRGIVQRRIMYKGQLVALNDGGPGHVSYTAIVQCLEELQHP